MTEHTEKVPTAAWPSSEDPAKFGYDNAAATGDFAVFAKTYLIDASQLIVDDVQMLPPPTEVALKKMIETANETWLANLMATSEPLPSGLLVPFNSIPMSSGMSNCATGNDWGKSPLASAVESFIMMNKSMSAMSSMNHMPMKLGVTSYYDGASLMAARAESLERIERDQGSMHAFCVGEQLLSRSCRLDAAEWDRESEVFARQMQASGEKYVPKLLARKRKRYEV